MHSNKDRESKSKKIEAILCHHLDNEVSGFKLLDLGTGSGLIGDYFSADNDVYYADVEDLRENKTRGKFIYIVDHEVDYPNESFDIIISNMVIEHTSNQPKHLENIYRLLKPGGICYLGAPNKYFPIEPHYLFPFVHYLPTRTESALMRWIAKFVTLRYPVEDIYLPTKTKLVRMLRSYFTWHEYTPDILRQPEKFNLNFRMFRNWNRKLLVLLSAFSPTNIYVLSKKDSKHLSS